jgi:DNA-binding transcriptional LysR family regulator
LTPAGDAFFKHGRLVLQQLEYLQSDLRDFLSNPQQQLRICANTTAISEFLPRVLSAYLAGGRNVNVELLEQAGSEIVQTIIEGAADIGIVEGNVSAEGVEAIPYRKERFVLVTGAEHPLGQKKEVAFADTVAFDYVALPGGVPVPDPVSRASLNVRARVATFEVMCRLVASNIGVAILPETAARRNAAFNPIRVVPLSDEWAEGVLQVCMRSLDSLPSCAQKLVELLIADGKRLTN